MIEEYKNVGWCQLEACVSMLNSMLELIVGDINEGKDYCIPPFKRSTHQYCMPRETIMEACKLFYLHEKELAEAADFESLRQTVYNIAERYLPKNVSKRSKKNQFGHLACYDFCMRYGYHRMENSLHPDFNLYPDNVYLQAGALIGAKALWKLYRLDKSLLKPHNDIPGKPIFIPFRDLEGIEGFPKVLLDLSPKTSHLHLSDEENEVIKMKMPMHLENFLCIYHLHLKCLAGTLTEEEKENHNKKINLI